MALGERTDPYMDFKFRVELVGIPLGGFSEVSGLSAETEVETYKEGAINDYTHFFPKGTKYSNLTLKRGYADMRLWAWYQTVVQGLVVKGVLNMFQADSEGNDRRLWLFLDIYPVKWTGSNLDAASNLVSFETIECVHGGMQQLSL